MTDRPPPSLLHSWPWAVAWAVLFAVAHTQSPLYYSNQHQYFVHGLANAGEGFLREDWLAKTQDPTPLFSGLVASTAREFGPWMYQVYFFLLLGGYMEAIRRLVTAVPGMPTRGPGEWLFLTAFVAAHAGIFRHLSVEWWRGDYPWYVQTGVAGQYILGPGLQPSAFGVLLIASLAAFVNGRPLLAAILAAASADFHSTYLLPAGLLTVGYVAVLAWEGRTRRGLVVAATALMMVLPVLVYTSRHFSPVDYDKFFVTQRILVEERIPHHAVVGRWLDGIAVGQLLVMAIGLYLVRKTRLFPVLLFAVFICVILTLIQISIDGYMLALLFPWRFSAVLMPVASALIFARVAAAVARKIEGRPQALHIARIACAVIVATSVGGGIYITAARIGYQTNDTELPLLDFVRENKRSGDVYLLPARFPNFAAAARGSGSNTFAPAPRAKPGAAHIPVDLQRFRLYTGAPIYIDFKSVPYGEDEVPEWRDRVHRCERWYDQRDWDSPEIWREVVEAGVTHVVTSADRDIKCRAFERIYADDHYRLYRLRPDRVPTEP